MSRAEKDVLIFHLFDLLTGLERRLGEVEAKIEKTSRNSSKPPSSDGLRKGAAEPRRRGANTTGGQAGHPGHTLRMVEQAEVMVDRLPQGTCSGGLGLADQVAVWKERRQQFDLPEPRIVVTEYRPWQVPCACGQIHVAAFPPQIPANTRYGPRLKAYAVGLIDGHFVGLGRTAEILGDQYGMAPSTGT
jgi:transposase